MVEGYREKILRDNGGKIAFFELEDLTGRVNVKVRGREIEQFAHLLTSGEPVVVHGKVSFPRRDEDAPEGDDDVNREPTIFLNDVKTLSSVVKEDTKGLSIRIDGKRARVEDLRAMRDLFVQRPGETRVELAILLEGAEAHLALSREFRVEVGDPLLSGIERLFGNGVAELR
jgi:DNA polymerase-3 subunit alpha